MYDDLDNKMGEKSLSSNFDKSAKPTMTVDVERYQAYLVRPEYRFQAAILST